MRIFQENLTTVDDETCLYVFNNSNQYQLLVVLSQHLIVETLSDLCRFDVGIPVVGL